MNDETVNPDTVKSDSERFRSFIGIKLNTAALVFLQAFKQHHTHRPWARQIRWTSDANLHITVRFLGDLTMEQIKRIESNLASLLENQAAFVVTMTAPQPFPTVKKSRMLAALIHKNQTLQQLAEDIEKIAVAAGVAPEERHFKGHITVGRFRKRVKGLEELLVITDTIEVPVDNVILFKSELKPTGAEYSEIAKFTLPIEK
jgi:2'-5' RNA ligase